MVAPCSAAFASVPALRPGRLARRRVAPCGACSSSRCIGVAGIAAPRCSGAALGWARARSRPFCSRSLRGLRLAGCIVGRLAVPAASRRANVSVALASDTLQFGPAAAVPRRFSAPAQRGRTGLGVCPLPAPCFSCVASRPAACSRHPQFRSRASRCLRCALARWLVASSVCARGEPTACASHSLLPDRVRTLGVFATREA